MIVLINSPRSAGTRRSSPPSPLDAIGDADVVVIQNRGVGTVSDGDNTSLCRFSGLLLGDVELEIVPLLEQIRNDRLPLHPCGTSVEITDQY